MSHPPRPIAVMSARPRPHVAPAAPARAARLRVRGAGRCRHYCHRAFGSLVSNTLLGDPRRLHLCVRVVRAEHQRHARRPRRGAAWSMRVFRHRLLRRSGSGWSNSACPSKVWSLDCGMLVSVVAAAIIGALTLATDRRLFLDRVVGLVRRCDGGGAEPRPADGRTARYLRIFADHRRTAA